MANKKQGWLQKAKRQMEKKGTVGAFTEYCGGKVTNQCIERALNSNDETLRKRAQFAKNMRNMETGGEVDTSNDKARRLPGGVMKPIGYGAFKFMGNKHDEAGLGSDSGIILQRGGKKKRGLEVEDGELQVDVDTTEGEKEYIVSNYIKNPTTGNTLAEDLERELKRAKNNQEAAKITARYVRLNEELKENYEDDEDDAQKGTMIDYGRSGDAIPVDPDDPDFKLNESGAQASEFIEGQSRTEDGLYKREGQEDPNVEALKSNNPWFNWDDFDPAKPADVRRFQKEYNEKAPEGKKIKVDGKLGEQTASAYIPYQAEKQEADSGLDFDESDIKIDEEEEETPTPTEEAPTEEAPAEPEGDPAKFRPRMPGTMLQAAGPIAALLRKQRVTERVQPAYRKGPRLGRENMDPQRAALQQQTQGQMEAATRGLAGPAAFAMQQAAASQADAGQRRIDAQEAGQNVQIANREKMLEADADRSNVASFMGAGQTNAAAVNRDNQIDEQRRLAAINQLGRIGTQTVKDYNEQYANFGSDMMEFGPPAADYYANVYKGNTPFGLGSRDIKVVNDQAAEVEAAFNKPPEEEQEARRGRYIKKSNKVRRKKRRK